VGTSASSTGPNNQSPLVPPWAEQSEPVSFDPADQAGDSQDSDNSDNQDSGNDPNQEIDNGKVQQQIPGPTSNQPVPNRLAGARRSFGDYARSGGAPSSLKSSLRKYAKGTGGGSGTSRRLASGISAGTALFRMMSGDNVTINNNTLSLRELNGLTSDQAIDKISEHLTPDNGDADAVRIALDYALVEAMPDQNDFDANIITADMIHEALSCYLTDLIFQDVVTGMGRAWFYTEHASKHHRMEEELRELVKVVTQQELEKLTHGSSGNITKNNITKLQIDAIKQTVEVWEKYSD